VKSQADAHSHARINIPKHYAPSDIHLRSRVTQREGKKKKKKKRKNPPTARGLEFYLCCNDGVERASVLSVKQYLKNNWHP